MIPARKQRLFRAWFGRHAVQRLRGAFSAVRVSGLEHLKAAAAAGPVLIVSNHTAWWDPLVALALVDRWLGLDGYAMMDEKNLRRLPFFGLVGAFGVDLARPGDGGAAIGYAAGLLDRPGRVVWVFSQGRERPVTERPLHFRRGAAALARQAGVLTVPIALRYEHQGLERPAVYLHVGAPLPPDDEVARGRQRQESAVAQGLDAIEAALQQDRARGWPALVEAPEPWLGRLATAALAWLSRGLLSRPQLE